MKYFFHIGYKGNRYRGWQRQPNVPNVQAVIEDALGHILKTDVTIMGCGRTDAQVHASQFFFHLEVDNAWDFDMMFRLNKLLPSDIAVFEIIPVDPFQHARYDATQRTYDYFIHTYKDPFLGESSAMYLESNLNLEEMKKAVAIFARHTDFRAFCKSPDKYKHTRCTIFSASLYRNSSGDKIRYQVSANRFLSGMVRFMVGTLLEVGRGKLTVDELEKYMQQKKLPEFVTPAYPQGLYLSKVNYPYLNIPARTDFSSIVQTAEEDWMLV